MEVPDSIILGGSEAYNTAKQHKNYVMTKTVHGGTVMQGQKYSSSYILSSTCVNINVSVIVQSNMPVKQVTMQTVTVTNIVIYM